MTDSSPGDRTYDYCLKFLLVGDSDVGKNEILNLLDEEIEVGALTSTISPKTTVILLEGKRVKLQLWDTSGQGRFGTIIRSYSRGAQHAPGIPKILLGNRLHLEFRRRVSRDDAEHFAKKRKMEYFEVSTLALFTICESFTELSRLVLTRNGMERLWKHNKVLSLQELCYRCVAPRLITVHNIDRLPLPAKIKFELKSFAKRDQFTISNTIRRNRPSLMANNISPTQSDYVRWAPNRYKRATSSDLFGLPNNNNNNSSNNNNNSSSNNNIDNNGHHSTGLVSPFLSKLTNRRRRTTTITLLGENFEDNSNSEIANNEVRTRSIENESSRSSCVLM